MSSKARKISYGRNLLLNEFEGREGLVYVRVSSKRQEIEGSGLESQEGRCIKDLKSIGASYIKTFPDSYSGGGDFMNRPAMRELLKYIDTHPHKKFVVVFDDLKRFARDVEFHFKLRTAFKIRDVVPRCLNYNFDDSPEGRFSELIMAGQAELERLQNQRQVIQKQKARLELGYWAFVTKRGYKREKSLDYGNICVPSEDGLSILKPALEGFANGTFLHKVDVCEFLVEKGFWTKQSPEKYIDKLTQILKDPFYAGFIEYPIWEVVRRQGRHKGIISLETFELIQKRLGKLDSGKRIRKDTSDDFPLRGLLVCSECQSHLTAAWCKGRNKKHPYYYCQKKGCISRNRIVRKDVIESKFNELLKKNTLKKKVSNIVEPLFDKVFNKIVSNTKKLENELKIKRTKLESTIDELVMSIPSTKSEVVKLAYEKQIESLAEEIKNIDSSVFIENIDLNIPYQTALNKAVKFLKSPYDVWVTLDTKEQQRLFYFIFERKLIYSVKEGYRTDQTTSAVRLFEEFSAVKTHNVELGEIESPCKR